MVRVHWPRWPLFEPRDRVVVVAFLSMELVEDDELAQAVRPSSRTTRGSLQPASYPYSRQSSRARSCALRVGRTMRLAIELRVDQARRCREAAFDRLLLPASPDELPVESVDVLRRQIRTVADGGADDVNIEPDR